MDGWTNGGLASGGQEPGRRAAAPVAQIVEAERGPLLGWITAMTRDRDAAEDVAQEALVRLWLEIEAGRAPDNPAAWLRRVSANLVASGARHAAVVRRYAETEAARPRDPVPSVEGAAEDRERRAALGVALATLARADCEAIVLAAAGVPRARIATHLGRTEPAARTLLCRARGRLRRAFDAELSGSAA